MALVTEQVTLDSGVFTHVYSDDGHYILQTDTNIQYVDAYDPVDNPLNHTYQEDEELIPTPDDIDPFAEAGRILLGVNEDE